MRDLDAEAMKKAAFAVFAKANENNLGQDKIEALWPSQHYPHWDGLAEAAVRAYLTAAIGAGGQAVGEEDALETIERELIDGLEVELSIGAENYTFNHRQLARRILSALSQPHPADERVVEAHNYETFRTFAHEATKAITNLTGGGSEYFGKEVDGVFLADLPRCVDRLRHRIDLAARLATEGRKNG